MIRFADKNNIFVNDIVYDVNHKTFDNFIFNQNSIRHDEIYQSALDDIIYSISKDMNCSDANVVINKLSIIFDTCPQFIERYIRGMYYRNNRIELNMKFGLNSIIIF